MRNNKDTLAQSLKKLVVMWQDIANKKFKMRSPMPSGIRDRLEDVKKDMATYEKLSLQSCKDLGVDTGNIDKYIRDHADDFNMEDRVILLTIAKMQTELSQVKDKLKAVLDGKVIEDDPSMMEGCKEIDEKQLKKKVRARKQRFKKAGLGDKWQKL